MNQYSNLTDAEIIAGLKQLRRLASLLTTNKVGPSFCTGRPCDRADELIAFARDSFQRIGGSLQCIDQHLAADHCAANHRR